MPPVGRDDDAGHVTPGELLDRGGRAVAGALVVHRDEGDRGAAEREAPGRDHGALRRVPPLRALAGRTGQRQLDADGRCPGTSARSSTGTGCASPACGVLTLHPAPSARTSPPATARGTLPAPAVNAPRPGGRGRRCGAARSTAARWRRPAARPGAAGRPQGLRLPQQDAVDLLAPDRRVGAGGVGGQATGSPPSRRPGRSCRASRAGPCRPALGCRGRAGRCSGRRSASCGCCRCRGSRCRRCRRWCAARPRSGCSARSRCPSPRRLTSLCCCLRVFAVPSRSSSAAAARPWEELVNTFSRSLPDCTPCAATSLISCCRSTACALDAAALASSRAAASADRAVP